MATPLSFCAGRLYTFMFQKFAEWLKVRETTAFTRLRRDSAKGLKPPIADFDSHSTPSWGGDWERKQLVKHFNASHKKHKHKKDEDDE